MYRYIIFVCGNVEKRTQLVTKHKEVDDDVYKWRVFTIWKDGLISIKYIDFMWRIALGGIKTEDFIARYKMPGVRVDCLFCPEVRESAEHLFCYCRSLLVVRRMAINICKNIDVIWLSRWQSVQDAVLPWVRSKETRQEYGKKDI